MKRLILSPVLLLAVVLTFFLGSVIQAQELRSAIQLTRSEQYDKAEEMLQQLIQKEPSNSKNYFYLGENYLLDYYSDTISNSLAVATKAAKESYEKGVSANPSDPLNYVGLAKVAFTLGDNRTADEMRTKARSFLLPYKKIKKISPPAPEYALALAKIAESYIYNNESVDTSLALPFIREAAKIDPKGMDVFLIAGDIYMLVNDGSNAIKNYNLAQFADPASPTANMKIGYVYVKGRALQSAIPFFEEAIKLNENYAPAYRELGQLYSLAQRYEQSKQYFEKYLELTAGNIPAKTRYVNALFYAKEYDEVIKNVEEIFAVDKSRTYMNRIAGYSAYDKDPADYDLALRYMETLFQTVAPERIIKKDYLYMARILLKKNQNYPKSIDELNNLKTQLDRDQSRYNAASSAADKAKYKASVTDLTNRIATLEKGIKSADVEIDRAFGEFDKLLAIDPQDRAVLTEMANSYYTYRRFEDAAKTWTKMIDLGRNSVDDYMQIGRAYYNGENYKAADGIFQEVLKKDPNYIQAYLYIARTYTRMDPDNKLGIAKPKFEQLVDKAKADSTSNASPIMEAFQYLGYYHLEKGDYTIAKNYYNRMLNLDANNRDYKIRGYNGIANLETNAASQEKTLEGKLAYLGRSIEAYNQILALDPNNAAARSSLKWTQDYLASVKKGINPNEIKGLIKDAATGQPIAFASIRVKDTAAENYTNQKGEYKFEIPQGSEILIISAKGYVSKEIPITASRTYNASLDK